MTTSNLNIRKSLHLSDSEYKCCSKCRIDRHISSFSEKGRVCSVCKMKTVFEAEKRNIEKKLNKGIRKGIMSVTVYHSDYQEFNFCVEFNRFFSEKDFISMLLSCVRSAMGRCDVYCSPVSVWEATSMYDEVDFIRVVSTQNRVVKNTVEDYLLEKAAVYLKNVNS